MRRRWLQFVVLGVAAVASMATSKRRGWSLEADVASDAPGKSRILIVESSDVPDVTLDNGERVAPMENSSTVSTHMPPRFLIPADRKLQEVSIHGNCGGGCNANNGCDPPPDAKLNIIAIKPAATWRREVVTPSKTEEIDFHRTRIPFVALHPVRLELTATGREGRAYLEGDWIHIDWAAYPEGPVSTTWSLKVIMEGLCPGNTPCEPPSSAKLDLGVPEKLSRGKRRGT